jgi:hypothetical protein
MVLVNDLPNPMKSTAILIPVIPEQFSVTIIASLAKSCIMTDACGVFNI